MDNSKALGQVILFLAFWDRGTQTPWPFGSAMDAELAWRRALHFEALRASRRPIAGYGAALASWEKGCLGKNCFFHGYDRIYPDINGFSMRFNQEN